MRPGGCSCGGGVGRSQGYGGRGGVKVALYGRLQWFDNEMRYQVDILWRIYLLSHVGAV